MSPTTDKIIARMPDFYNSGETENLLYKFVELHAATLDTAEEDLLSIMKMHWVKAASNVLPQSTDIATKGDLDKIFVLYLESLGATALLKQGKRRTDTEGGNADDALYRQRILSVINVLKNGAATKSGIIDIIAANLGIAADLPFAAQAHDTIDIIEFLPKITNSADSLPLLLFTPFEATNESLVPSIAEFRLKLYTKAEVTLDGANKVALPPLLNPRFRNLTTGEVVQIANNAEVKPGEELIFLPNGTGLLRGQPVEIIGKKKMTLPPGDSNVQFEAEVGYPQGAFDKDKFFDFSQFDEPLERQIGQFDRGTFDGAVFNYDKSFASLSTTYLRLFPGSFTAVVPWDIPGFSTTIKITADTIRRLPLFGADPLMLAKIEKLVGIEFDTIETFYTALLWHTADFPLPAEITEAHLTILRDLGCRKELIDKVNALRNTHFKPGKDFYDALTKLVFAANNTLFLSLFWKIIGFTTEPIVTDETLDAVLRTLRTAGFRDNILTGITDSLDNSNTGEVVLSTLDFVGTEAVYLIPKHLDFVFQECSFVDKFARFNISPRAQLSAIINRVKAAGVYATMAFEKRFWENQELGEALGLVWHRIPEDQEMVEADFLYGGRQTNEVVHELEETFAISGVFDYTHFDSLNAFA